MNVATLRPRHTLMRAAPDVMGVADRWPLHYRRRVLVYSLRRLGRESPAVETPARR